jgi:hypothetical protein
MSSHEPSSFPPDLSNPYAAPQAEVAAPLGDFDVDQLGAEAIRKAHLSHEASVKSIGSLHFLFTFFSMIGVLSAIYLLTTSRDENTRTGAIIILVVYAGLSVVHLGMGIGLHRLQTWARWIETALVGLAFAATVVVLAAVLALGSLPQTYPILLVYLFFLVVLSFILYLLLSPKGSMVFSPEYREIINKTPYLKYKTSLITKLVLVLFIAVVTLAVVGAFVTSKR